MTVLFKLMIEESRGNQESSICSEGNSVLLVFQGNGFPFALERWTVLEGRFAPI